MYIEAVSKPHNSFRVKHEFKSPPSNTLLKLYSIYREVKNSQIQYLTKPNEQCTAILRKQLRIKLYMYMHMIVQTKRKWFEWVAVLGSVSVIICKNICVKCLTKSREKTSDNWARLTDKCGSCCDSSRGSVRRTPLTLLSVAGLGQRDSGPHRRREQAPDAGGGARVLEVGARTGQWRHMFTNWTGCWSGSNLQNMHRSNSYLKFSDASVQVHRRGRWTNIKYST